MTTGTPADEIDGNDSWYRIALVSFVYYGNIDGNMVAKSPRARGGTICGILLLFI